MKKKLLLLFLSTIILVTGFVTLPAKASPDGTELGTDPLPCTGQVGTRQNVGVIITDVPNLHVWQFNMTFNPAVLAVVNVTEGPFLRDGAGPTRWLPPEIHNETGWVGAACSLAQPFPDWGAEGSGVLANITFYVKAKGKSDLHFAGIGSSTYLREWDPWNKVLVEVSFTPKDGFFQVPQGDVSNDGVVNANDLLAVGNAYATSEGQTSYNPDADLNKDKVVDKSDLEIIRINYGAN